MAHPENAPVALDYVSSNQDSSPDDRDAFVSPSSDEHDDESSDGEEVQKELDELHNSGDDDDDPTEWDDLLYSTDEDDMTEGRSKRDGSKKDPLKRDVKAWLADVPSVTVTSRRPYCWPR